MGSRRFHVLGTVKRCEGNSIPDRILLLCLKRPHSDGWPLKGAIRQIEKLAERQDLRSLCSLSGSFYMGEVVPTEDGERGR